MKKLMVVVVALAAGVLSGAFADGVTSTRWIGPDGQQDWNQPANWSAGVPSGAMDAVFIPVAANYVHRLTPPAEFTGRILVSNETAIATTDKTKPQSAMLELDVVAGAQWTIGGNGQIIATDGVGARLGTDFKGRVEVPFGRCFTVPEGLNAAVQYLGLGTLTLSSTNQLKQVSGFTGELVLPGDADLQDIAQIQGKKVRLAAGANLNLAESMLALNATERISPFAEGGWSLNGGRTSAGAIFEPEFRDGPAYVLDNGDLQLVDDPAQVHSAIYTNRMFKLYDDFGVKFTWHPSQPSDSRMAKAGKGQIWSGWFQVGLQTSTPDNCSRKREIPVTNFYGVGFYCYRTSDNTQHLVWHDNTTLDGYPTYYNMPERELGGIVFPSLPLG